jgi:ketosteroid isomerase-like protein
MLGGECTPTQLSKIQMKLIQLLAGVMALSLMTAPILRAQETETPTDKASPTPAETKKSDDETKSETAKTDAETSATPVEKSAQKKEKAETSAAARTSTAAAKPMAKGSMDSQLKEIENRWEAAFQSRDVKVPEEVLADKYVLTNDKGKVFNRRGALKEFKKNPDTLEKATNSEVVVHPINQDAAVVTGMSHEVGKDKSGKMFDRTYRWTDTFVNHNGKWQCVASHVTLVAQK